MTSDQELTRRVASGDPEAAAQLYIRFARLVHGIAARIVRDPVRADDVLQATFLQVVQQFAKLDPARGNVSSWLFAIARSRAIDTVRTAHARERVLESFDDDRSDVDGRRAPSVEEAYIAADTSVRLHHAVKALPVPQRLALELAFFRGLTHPEVAAALRQPLGTVKTRIRLALSRLRYCLTRSEVPMTETEPSPFTVALADYLSSNPLMPAIGSSANLVGVTVLVVDDDLETVELIRAVLESAGASVMSSQSVAGALSRVHATWPHVLLADLGMPGEDGYALLQHMRVLGDAVGRALPAAAFTARADEREKVLAAGFAMHLRKPVEPRSIVEAVEALTRAA